MRKETLLSPISGVIAKVYAPTGSMVKENELILQIECMKMYFDVTAGLNGELQLSIHEGQFVQESEELGTIIEV